MSPTSQLLAANYARDLANWQAGAVLLDSLKDDEPDDEKAEAEWLRIVFALVRAKLMAVATELVHNRTSPLPWYGGLLLMEDTPVGDITYPVELVPGDSPMYLSGGGGPLVYTANLMLEDMAPGMVWFLRVNPDDETLYDRLTIGATRAIRYAVRSWLSGPPLTFPR